MDLIKKLTGKNPSEFEPVAQALVNNSDKELFSALVKQDDFLFDFIKDNVAKRIQKACNKDNYLNLLEFFDYYSPSYDTMIAEVLHTFSGDELLPAIKEIFIDGEDSAKAYAAKYFSFVNKDLLGDIIPLLRQTAFSKFEPLSVNSIEVLSLLNDEESKNEALSRLNSDDDFMKFEAVKFLVNYQAKDSITRILEVMKESSLSENIACQIPFLIPLEDLIKQDEEAALLVLCYIVNAIPEIVTPDSVIDYGLYNILEIIMKSPITSTSAVLLRLAKEKFQELSSNEEYIFDCDRNTKNEIKEINGLLSSLNTNKLDSLLYDELFEGSDFVFFALDYVNEIEELEVLLDSQNPTLVLKVLTILKEKGSLTESAKEEALKHIQAPGIREIIEVL